MVGSISPSNYKTYKTYKTISIPLVDNDNDKSLQVYILAFYWQSPKKTSDDIRLLPPQTTYI